MFAMIGLGAIEIVILLVVGLLMFGVPLALVLIFVVFRSKERPSEPEDDAPR